MALEGTSIPDGAKAQIRRFRERLDALAKERAEIDRKAKNVQSGLTNFIAGLAHMAEIPEEWRFDHERMEFRPQPEQQQAPEGDEK